MGKLAFSLSILLAFSALAFSTAYTGDGTFKLYHNDTVLSNNSFLINLDTIVWGYTEGSSAVVIKNYTFIVTRLGGPIQNVTLAKGQSYVVINGSRNVKITVNDTGYDSSGAGGFNVTPYALASVASSPEPVTVKIANVKITPDYYFAVINWTANVSSNGTVRVYDNSTNALAANGSQGAATAHSVTVHGLKSNTPYYTIITACTAESCVNSGRYNFTTTAVIPVISNVTVLGVSDVTADIYWVTDVDSDESVYYRASGESAWHQVPEPDSPLSQIEKYMVPFPGKVFIPNPGDPVINPWESVFNQMGIQVNQQIGQQAGGMAYQAPKEPVVMLAASGLGGALPKGGGLVNPAISAGVLTGIKDSALATAFIRHEHQIKLRDLEDDTTYEFKASSCADKCANSTVYSFRTNRTMVPPRIIIYGTTPINHGTSEILTIDVLSDNPGGHVVNGTVSWLDDGTMHTLPLHFGNAYTSWYVMVPASMPYRAIDSITFKTPGSHGIIVQAVDNYGKVGNKTYILTVKPKVACKNSNAIYYPSDTPCSNKWPYDPKGTINYNTGIDKCHAFEVCSNDLDYALADAETCCNGDRLYSDDKPPQNRGYTYQKSLACDDAIKAAEKAGAMTSLGGEASMAVCKANYLVLAVGPQAVYMKDYYTGEWCCADSSGLCPSDPHFSAGPWPSSNIQFNSLKCSFYDYGIFGKYPKTGWYGSDTDYTANNNAAVDLPAHSSVNVMNTGSCVDYSFVVTTLLRKAGFGPGDIMSMNAPGHLYNLVHMPGTSKYMFIDTTGNGGDFFTGPGWTWTSDGATQSHCTYKPAKCSNDLGIFGCPAKSSISGC